MPCQSSQEQQQQKLAKSTDLGSVSTEEGFSTFHYVACTRPFNKINAFEDINTVQDGFQIPVQLTGEKDILILETEQHWTYNTPYSFSSLTDILG